jgi:4-hydroxybenzoate polyprenyltransferase/phosphoserine phosphatase
VTNRRGIMCIEDMVLVVDLDGTLIKSDMLYESFWGAFASRWTTPFTVVKRILKGKVALKFWLAAEAEIDIAHLPYDEVIIKYIKQYRAKGGRVVLVTATHQLLADKIGDYLKIFDEVHGSNGNNNLKGSEKAKFLVSRFGINKFCYIGDSSVDLPVWAVSGKVVTVNSTDAVRKQADDLEKPIEHLKTFTPIWHSYIKALRPHQWIKNILVFLPMLASHKLDIISLINSIHAFVAFCLIASSVYVLNDLLDLNADRAHPRKRSRPFASGAIPLAHGNLIALFLLFGGIVFAALLGWMFLLAIGAYYAITLVYSLVLKRKIVIDICVLGGLYSMRILAGGVAVNTELSVWLLAFSIFFFMSLAAVKRQAELVDLARRNEITTSGRGYNIQDLPIISQISLTAGYISVLVMALYINSPNVLELYQTPQLLWGICGVLIYWLTRMVLITQRGLMHDDPVSFAATDRISQFCFIGILGLLISGAIL